MSKRRQLPAARSWLAGRSWPSRKRTTNFIDFYPTARQAAQRFVLIGGARLASVLQQLRYRVLGNLGGAGRRADAHAFDQAPEKESFGFAGQCVLAPCACSK